MIDPTQPTHRQIATITNMVAFYTAGDDKAHSIVTAEAVGVLTGVYKLPEAMTRREAMKAIGALIARRERKQGRMYYMTNQIINDHKLKMKQARIKE